MLYQLCHQVCGTLSPACHRSSYDLTLYDEYRIQELRRHSNVFHKDDHPDSPAPSSPIGPKFKLTLEFEAAVCRLNQHKTLVSKILSSRFLRRWENHSLRLRHNSIASVQNCGFMSESIPYDSISEVYATKRWDPHHKFCLRIALADGTSVLLQAPSSYLRDQWLHSILWSKQVARFSMDASRNRGNDSAVVLRNMKAMVDLSLTTPLQDTSIYQTTLDILCGYLHNIDDANSDDLGGCQANQVIAVMTPLLERCTPTQPICEYLSKLCDSDLPLVTGQLAPVIERIIKRNTDFGKYPGSRFLVECYLKALSRLNKNPRRTLGQSPKSRARSRSAERCLDLECNRENSRHQHRCNKSGSSLSVMGNICRPPATIHEQSRDQPYHAGSSLSVFNVSSECQAPAAAADISTLSSHDASLTESQLSQTIAINPSGSIINVHVCPDTEADGDEEQSRLNDQSAVNLEDEVFSRDDGLRVTIRSKTCAVELFTRQMHGDSSACPHPRILPNFVGVCLSAIYRAFPEKDSCSDCDDPDVLCFVKILVTLSEFEDWRLPLSQILQPIPFPSRFIEDTVLFAERMAPIVMQFAQDARCEVHQCLVGLRQSRNGWLQIFAAGHDSEMYSKMCHTLLKCNCLRKAFLSDSFSCSWALEPLILSSLRHQTVAVQCLAILVETDLIKGDDLRSSACAALQASPAGQRLYETIQAKKQMYTKSSEQGDRLKPLNSVVLPPKSNDRDLYALLKNLSKSHDLSKVQTLSLAFTATTDRSVESIVRLKSLKKLNLWSTRITDAGLESLCYHLRELEDVNLCETPIGERGVEALVTLNNLRIVNLNSTKVTMDAFCKLKERFPEMEICDVRYTEAW